MNILRKLTIVLLSAIMFLGAALTSVSAKGSGEGKMPVQPVTDQTEEADPLKEIDEDKIISEEEIILEEEVVSEEESEEVTAEELQFVAPITNLIGGGYSVNAAGDDLAALSTGKTLTYNNDGTYKLELSVKGDSQSSSSTETTSANVLIVFDVSNSMTANKAQSTPVPTVPPAQAARAQPKQHTVSSTNRRIPAIRSVKAKSIPAHYITEAETAGQSITDSAIPQPDVRTQLKRRCTTWSLTLRMERLSSP